jgi:membrane protein involved in colicin uptake
MRIAAVILLALAALAGVICWTVWRADTAPVTTPPSAVQQGQQQLHAQLQQTIQHESEVEKQAWGSMDSLVKLLHWHQQRIDRLTGNPQATEVLAYDHDSIVRIQTRINQLSVEEKAKELAAEEKAKEDAVKAKEDAIQQKAERAAAAVAAQKPVN